MLGLEPAPWRSKIQDIFSATEQNLTGNADTTAHFGSPSRARPSIRPEAQRSSSEGRAARVRASSVSFEIAPPRIEARARAMGGARGASDFEFPAQASREREEFSFHKPAAPLFPSQTADKDAPSGISSEALQAMEGRLKAVEAALLRSSSDEALGRLDANTKVTHAKMQEYQARLVVLEDAITKASSKLQDRAESAARLTVRTELQEVVQVHCSNSVRRQLEPFDDRIKAAVTEVRCASASQHKDRQVATANIAAWSLIALSLTAVHGKDWRQVHDRMDGAERMQEKLLDRVDGLNRQVEALNMSLKAVDERIMHVHRMAPTWHSAAVDAAREQARSALAEIRMGAAEEKKMHDQIRWEVTEAQGAERRHRITAEESMLGALRGMEEAHHQLEKRLRDAEENMAAAVDATASQLVTLKDGASRECALATEQAAMASEVAARASHMAHTTSDTLEPLRVALQAVKGTQMQGWQDVTDQVRGLEEVAEALHEDVREALREMGRMTEATHESAHTNLQDVVEQARGVVELLQHLAVSLPDGAAANGMPSDTETALAREQNLDPNRQGGGAGFRSLPTAASPQPSSVVQK
ncbi:hypothetical protein CYMTET_56440, partial [Cymbomonas tetramitiformis]